MSCPCLSPDTGGRDIDGSSFIPRHHLLMPVLLYFLLLCKSSKERCPRPLFGAKASAKVRTSPETAKHFRHIFSIFFPENTGIYPLQPEKSTPHGKNNPPRLQNGPISKACLLKFEIWDLKFSQVRKKRTERNYRKFIRNLWWFLRKGSVSGRRSRADNKDPESVMAKKLPESRRLREP